MGICSFASAIGDMPKKDQKHDDLATGTPGLGRAQNAYMLADAMLIARRKA